jgi:predicted RNase H-like HicB family nuclease
MPSRQDYILPWCQEIFWMSQPIIVSATWDAEAKVWVAESDQVPGLATGADTLEELVEKLKVAIPELLTENGVPFEPDNLPFTIEAQRSEYANVAA